MDEIESEESSCPIPTATVSRDTARKLLFIAEPSVSFPQYLSISVKNPESYDDLLNMITLTGTSLDDIKHDGMFKGNTGGSGRSAIILNREPLERRAGISWDSIKQLQEDSTRRDKRPPRQR